MGLRAPSCLPAPSPSRRSCPLLAALPRRGFKQSPCSDVPGGLQAAWCTQRYGSTAPSPMAGTGQQHKALALLSPVYLLTARRLSTHSPLLGFAPGRSLSPSTPLQPLALQHPQPPPAAMGPQQVPGSEGQGEPLGQHPRSHCPATLLPAYFPRLKITCSSCWHGTMEPLACFY